MANSQFGRGEGSNRPLLALMVLAGKVIDMKHLLWLNLRLLAVLIMLLRSGGIRTVLGQNLLLRQQMLVMRLSRGRAPNLRTADP